MQNPAPIEKAVAEVGEDLLSKSLPLTPKDDNDLRLSAGTRPVKQPKGPAVRVGYGMDYALAVHEMSDDETDWTTPGTGAKYLEGPFAENKKRYASHIKNAARKGVSG